MRTNGRRVWSLFGGAQLVAGSLRVVLLVLAVSGAGQCSLEPPPAWGLAWVTVYTLRAKELQVGLASIMDPNTLYVHLGLRDDVEIRLLPILVLAQNVPNVGGKLHASLTPELNFAVPPASITGRTREALSCTFAGYSGFPSVRPPPCTQAAGGNWPSLRVGGVKKSYTQLPMGPSALGSLSLRRP